MKELNYVETINLEHVANTVANRINYTELEVIGWVPIEMKLMGYTPDGIPLKIIVKYDQELQRTVARHE